MLEWDVADLRNCSDRDQRFKLAIDALISLDLADKVSRAGPPRREDSPEVPGTNADAAVTTATGR